AFPRREVGFAASRQSLYKTEDGGTTWTKLAAEPPGRVYVLHFTDARTGWLGSDRLRRTEDGGATWTPVPLPEEMRAGTGLGVAGDGGVLAGGTNGSGRLALFRKPAGEAPWQKLALPKSSAGESFEQWYLGALTVTGPRRAFAVLFRGTEDGGAVLRTDD